MKLILASNSPRRQELLKECGYPFEIIISDYDEKAFSSDPYITASAFAKGKAQSVFETQTDKDKCVVVGADTVVYNQGKILNKPKNDAEATEMLKFLSGKTHSVITGYCVMSAKRISFGHVETFVTFNDLSDEVIAAYVKSGLYKGKSGSYGIQDPYPLVKGYEGSLYNVVGLPTETLFPIIKEFMTK